MHHALFVQRFSVSLMLGNLKLQGRLSQFLLWGMSVEEVTTLWKKQNKQNTIGLGWAWWCILGKQRQDDGCLAARISGSCELAHLSAGNQTGVPWSRKCF